MVGGAFIWCVPRPGWLGHFAGMGSVIHFRGNDARPHGSPTLRRYCLGLGPDAANPRDIDERAAHVDLVQGPVESGKTAGSFAKLYSLICTMPRSKDGIRRSRGLIHRQTYPEITDTVLPDFLEWFPEDLYGKVSGSEPVVYKMRFLDVECDVVFMAIPDESEKTLKKLRSSFFTWAYGNEGQFNTLKMVTSVIDRTGRYPRKIDCPDYDRKKRYFMDMNAPERHDHWVLYMRGDTPLPADMPADQRMAYEKPEDWDFYVQPGAVLEKIDEKGELVGYELNPEAENLQNMGDAPYLPAIPGKPRDQIDRDFRNITRPARQGALRYPMFSRERHVSKEPLRPYTDAPIILGMDFGLTPAVCITQHVLGRWYVLWSITAQNLTADEFAPKVKEVLLSRFPFCSETGIVAWGDPAGGWSDQGSKTTSMKVWAQHGIDVRAPAKKDQPETRMTMGRRVLSEFPDGNPKIMLDPVNCQEIISSLENMSMATVKTQFGLKTQERLVKDKWSHCGEALEYALWGGGEAGTVLHGQAGRPKGRVFNTKGNGSVFTKGKSWSSRRSA